MCKNAKFEDQNLLNLAAHKKLYGSEILNFAILKMLYLLLHSLVTVILIEVMVKYVVQRW